MLYREIIAVCSEIHTKHINTLCGLNVEFEYAKFVVTVRLKRLRIKKFMFTNIYKLIRTTKKTFIYNTPNTLFTLQKEIYDAYFMNVTKIIKVNRFEKRGQPPM